MARRDPHSFNDDTQPETESLVWLARVDFETRTLHGDATLTFRWPGAGRLDLDTRDLTIESVADHAGEPLEHVVHPVEPILGARLAITLRPGTAAVRIRYRTSPGASALQWLDP